MRDIARRGLPACVVEGSLGQPEGPTGNFEAGVGDGQADPCRRGDERHHVFADVHGDSLFTSRSVSAESPNTELTESPQVSSSFSSTGRGRLTSWEQWHRYQMQ